MARKKTHEEYIEELKLTHPNIEVLENYVDCKTKILHKCSKGHVRSISPDSISCSKYGCPKCAYEIVKSNKIITHEEFLDRLSVVNSSVEVLSKYTLSKNKVTVRCLKCGCIFDAYSNGLISGRSCPYCCKSPNGVFVGFNDLHTVCPDISKWLLNYEDGYKYTRRSMKKVDWKCPNCGSIIKNKSIDNISTRKKLPCGICSDGISYPEKIMFSVLSQLDIEFETEKSFPWSYIEIDGECKKVRYDFYFKFEEKEYLIETDGRWHTTTNKMSGMTKECAELIDSTKDKLALKHNIDIFRIDCAESNFDYIKENIINSKLALVLDLNIIDWDKCCVDGVHSYKLDAAKLWEQELTVHEVAKILKRDVSTIRIWLKTCAEAGLCNYSSKARVSDLEKRKSPIHSKRIVCVETNKIYNTLASASRDTSAIAANIAKCCQNKRNTAGGLHWKYAS